MSDCDQCHLHAEVHARLQDNLAPEQQKTPRFKNCRVQWLCKAVGATAFCEHCRVGGVTEAAPSAVEATAALVVERVAPAATDTAPAATDTAAAAAVATGTAAAGTGTTVAVAAAAAAAATGTAAAAVATGTAAAGTGATVAVAAGTGATVAVAAGTGTTVAVAAGTGTTVAAATGTAAAAGTAMTAAAAAAAAAAATGVVAVALFAGFCVAKAHTIYTRRSHEAALAPALHLPPPPPHLRPSFPDVCLSTLPVSRGNEIGFGATSTVHSIEWDRMDCAAKVYRRTLRDNAAVRELLAAPRLRHANIVTVYARISDGVNPAGLLLERLDGGDLAAACQRPDTSSWTDAAKLRVGLCVASAVACAHGRGVVHSDIKPANVLLSKRLHDDGAPASVKLADFGSAKIVSTMGVTEQTGGLGTPAFMAPEFSSAEDAAAACDVFALGMLIWHVFHPGVSHGLGSSAVDIRVSIQQGRRPAVAMATVPERVAEIIGGCLQPDPAARPIADVVADVLQRQCSELADAADEARHVRQPNNAFWDLVQEPGMERQLSQLPEWRRGRSSTQITLCDVPRGSPASDFVRSRLRGQEGMRITRVAAVQHRLASNFVERHQCNEMSVSENPKLRLTVPTDPATTRALSALRAASAPAEGATSRVVWAWHGTASQHLVNVCAQGVRPLAETDPGYFGAGSYFALEADYAARYSKSSPGTSELGVVLFAVSVTNVRVVTPERDYLTPPREKKAVKEGARLACQKGISNFGRKKTSADIAVGPLALADGCDAHFIPVKNYGLKHPLDESTLLSPEEDGDFQACDASEAEYHELVVRSYESATPVAIVYFKRACSALN